VVSEEKLSGICAFHNLPAFGLTESAITLRRRREVYIVDDELDRFAVARPVQLVLARWNRGHSDVLIMPIIK